MNNINIYSQNVNEDLKPILENYIKEGIFIITDENTSFFCFPVIKDLFEDNYHLIEIKSGEANKILETAEYLWNYLSEKKASRKSLIINLGGGIITDIGGFVASTYQRGIDFINIPTTLLAMVDAAIGGKNGINLNSLKNQIGSINCPIKNIISAEFLSTLPKNELVAGFAEVLKHALLKSESEWQKIKSITPENIDVNTLQEIVNGSAKIKEYFVEKDPMEKGVREALNFGHTIGHGIETYFNRKNSPILHGEAVAIGIITELFLSNKVLNFDFHKLFEVAEYVASYFPSYKIDYKDYNEVYEIMKHDKKNKENKIRFSLLKQIGEIQINQVCEKEDVFEALNFYYQLKK